MTLTKLEKLLIENMITNDFGEAPDHCIWSSAWMDGARGLFCAHEQISGVIASLVKKGIVTRKEYPEWERHLRFTIELTEAGQALVHKMQGEQELISKQIAR